MRKLISCVLCLMMLVPMIGSADIMSVQAQTTDTDTTEIDNDYVETIDFSSFDQHIDEDDELYAMLKQGLLNANKYALTTWFDEVKNLDEDTNEYYDLKTASGNSTVNEYVYRFPATQAFGIAVAIRTGIYDEDYVGVSEAEAKARAIKMVTSVAYGHKANGGHYQSWGDDWQAAHWAYYAGYTAWLFWDELSAQDQQLIKNMIIYEADRFNNTNALYWKTANGKELYAGDSKIEEDGWNAELLNLAAQMFPKHENHELWEYRFIEYQLAAFATPQMNESDEIIHGQPAKDWVYGYNVNADGTVINHGIVHPTYNAASTGVNTSIVNSLLHEKLPLAAKYNLDKLYDGLTEVEFRVEDGYQEPGGTIYTEGSYEIYCPQGNDWGGEIYDVYVNIDVSAYVYGYGEEADEWAKLHLQKVLDQQSRHEDGHTYKDASENSYAGREEAISMRLGCAFMTYWLSLQEPVEYENDAVSYPAAELPQLGENMQRIFASEGVYVKDGTSADTCFYPEDAIQVKKDGVGYYREGYIKYDLRSLQEMPEKAEVFIPVVSVGDKVASAGIEHTVEVISDSWDEEELTYNNRPSASGTIVAQYQPTADGVLIDISEQVREAYESDKTVSLKIYSTVQVGGDTFVNYGSPRQADPNYRPQMLLTYGEDASLHLIGSEQLSSAQDFSLTLEATNLHQSGNYAIEIQYDRSMIDLDEVTSASDAVQIEAIDTTYAGYAHIDVNGDVRTGSLLDLAWTPVNAGTTTITARILENDEEVLRCTKQITLTQASLSGSFRSRAPEDTIAEPLDDTTARPGYDASANAARNEMETKTYGNNANTRQLFVKFPLPQSDIDKIDTVTLNLYVDRIPGDPIVVRFQALDDDDWSEETLTWDNRPESTKAIDGTQETIPAQADEDTLYEGTVSASGYLSIDVTEKVKALLSEGKSVISIFGYSASYGNNSAVFNTKEHEDASTHPYIQTSYVHDQGVSLQLTPQNQESERFGTMTFDLSAASLGDLQDPVIAISYPDSLRFDEVEAINDAVRAEVIEKLDGQVRIKLTKDQDTVFTEDITELIRLHFTAISSGSGTLSATAMDETGDPLETAADFTILPAEHSGLRVSLDGEAVITPQSSTTLTATFHALTPGTIYEIHLSCDARCFDIKRLYVANQNLIILEDDGAGTLRIMTLASEEDYVLQITLNTLQRFEDTQLFTVELHDEDHMVNAVHNFSCETEAPSTDKSALTAAYERYAKLDKDEYTPESWQEMADALEQARYVIDDETADQDEIDAAAAALKNAYAKLIKAEDAQPEPGQEPDSPDTGIRSSSMIWTSTILLAAAALLLLHRKHRTQN